MKQTRTYYSSLFMCLILQLIFLNMYTSAVNDNVSDSDTSTPKAHIIVVMPTTKDENEYCDGSQPKWERGEEILPGAHIAVEDVNAHLNMPSKLAIVPIMIPQCGVTTRIGDFVGNLTSVAINPIAIVGYFCDNVAQFFSQLANHKSFGVIQISASLPILRHSSHMKYLPNIYHILPSPSVCSATAAQFIHKLGWSSIGVISKGWYHDKQFSRMKGEFLRSIRVYNIAIVFQMEENVIYSSRHIIDKLKQSIAKVIVVFLPPSEAADIICESYQQGLIWPKYVWIYVETNSADIRNTRSCSGDMLAAKEKAIFVHLHNWLPRADETLISGRNHSTFTNIYTQQLKERPLRPQCLQFNHYASILYDSIWAIAKAMNRSQMNTPLDKISNSRESTVGALADVIFQGATGLVNFSQEGAAVQLTVDISQIQQGKTIQIGSYDSSSNELMLNEGALGYIPSDDLDHTYLLYPLYLTVLLLVFMSLSLIFTTVTMSLFIHYRNNPEIKAASSVLSLCMFMGCYCLIISSLLHTVASGHIIENTVLRYAECWGNTFLFTVGIDMVLATVSAKAFRIYHIFKTMTRLSPKWSDKHLFLAILGILAIKVLLMVIWASVDINHLIDERKLNLQSFPPHYVIIQKCYSRNLGLWVGLAFGYSGILFIPMIIAAILTRKLKGDRFKDSKKICALVAVLIILMSIGTSLWFFLRAVEENIGSKVVYSLGFTLAALACQIFLFLPKIVPSVRRHADILKPTWVDTSISVSCDLHAHDDHHYYRLY